MRLIRVSRVLYYNYSTNNVFELLPSLLPPMSCAKTNQDAVFGWRFHPKLDPLFLVDADPITISENGRLKNRHYRVYKRVKQVFRPANVLFRVQKRCHKRWPETRIKYCTFFFNQVLTKNNQQKRSPNYVHARTSSPHHSISAHAQMKLCRWGEGKHGVCASREEGCLPPRSRRSCVSQHVAGGGCPRPRQVRVVVVCVLCLSNLQSPLRGE